MNPLKEGGRVLVAMGSNVGDPVETVRQSGLALQGLASGSFSMSGLWSTEAIGLLDGGGDFINACASFDYGGAPSALLGELQALELHFGRPENHGVHRSRTLDLDIIAFGNTVIRERELRIPHPRAHERLFVLLPLQEIEPGFRFPDRKETLEELIGLAPAMKLHRLRAGPARGNG